MALIESYNQNPHALLFLDPPYLIANNDNYHTASVNVYEYLYNHSIDAMAARMVLVLEDNWIIRLLFKANISAAYGKQYMGSKKKTSHLVIKNAGGVSA